MLLDRLKTSALAKDLLIFVVTRQAKIGLEEKSTSKGTAEFLNTPMEKDAFVNTVTALPTAPTQSPVPPQTIPSHVPTSRLAGFLRDSQASSCLTADNSLVGHSTTKTVFTGSLSRGSERITKSNGDGTSDFTGKCSTPCG